MIRELGRKVKDGILTWEQATEEYNRVNGTNLTKEALRCRYKYLHDPYVPVKKEKASNEYTTEFEDGTLESRKIVEYNKEIFGDKQKLLSYLGYNPNEWQFVYVSTSLWEQHTKEQNTKQMYAVKFKVKPVVKEQLEVTEYLDIIKEVLSENIEPLKLEKITKELDLDKNRMLILSIADLHLGRYCSEISTGYNYDLKIAEEEFNNIIKNTIEIQKHKRVGELLYTIGNDFFNSDNINYTTSKGTVLNNNIGTYKEMYRMGLEMQIRALKSLRKEFEKVNVYLVEGNHDRILSYTLYLALENIFKDDNTIKFGGDYKKTQAVQFGKSAIFLDHGDSNFDRTIRTLPTLFPKVYGNTINRIALLHHLHSEKATNEDVGITAYRLPSIVPTDEYEDVGKFIKVNGRQQLFEVSKDNGVESINYIYTKSLRRKR